MKKIAFCFLFLLITTLLHAQQGFSSFMSKNPRMFIGAIMEAKNINDDSHRFLNVSLAPITISFSSSVKSQKITPSYDEMTKMMDSFIKKGEIPPVQNIDFSYSIRELKSYAELNALFGQKINPTLFFDVLVDKKLVHPLVAINLEQKIFSIFMDIPDNGSILIEKNLGYDIDKLVYLNSVTFGRKTVILIESGQPLNKLKVAINDVIRNYNHPERIAQTSHAVLSNSDIRVMIAGKNTTINIQNNNALIEAIRHFNRKITVEDFISPIFFTAAWVKDNSMFENKLTF